MCTGDIMSFTTRPPAVTHVLGSGRNVGALSEGRRLSFWSLGTRRWALQTTFAGGHNIFLMPTVPKLMKL